MTKSFFFRLFLTTAAIISLFVGGVLLLQPTLFRQYYSYTTMQTVSLNMVTLSKDYAGKPDEAQEKMGIYAQAYGSSIVYAEFSSDQSQLVFKQASDAGNAFYSRQIAAGLKHYREDKITMDTGKPFSFQASDAQGLPYIVTMNVVMAGSSPAGLLFAFTPIQSIDVATDALKGYSVLFFAVSLIFILFISLIFSRQISRPLVHINGVASRIAQMDFSQRCTVRSKDELGCLAATINALSDNLNRTIAELKQANGKLAIELAKQKELENRRKQFVDSVSHELKTPISIIRGYAEGLQDAVKQGEVKNDYIDIIHEETEKMSVLVSNMLTMSQLESCGAEFCPEPISVHRLLRYVIKKWQPAMQKKGIEFNLAANDENLLASGDPFRIEQVLTNLIGNAIQYSPEQGIITASVEDKGTSVFVSIENSGVHIPEEELDKVWEKFYRVEKSRNRELGGTGLGLSIVKSILEMHQSEYGVRNSRQGVVFYFSLDKGTE